MLFYTPQFLLFSLFLLATLGVVHRNEPRKLVLLAASYIFYMAWNPAFIALIVFSTAVDYWVGARMAGEAHARRRRLLLIVSLVANLGMLGYFKYAGLFSDSALALARLMGFEVHWSHLEILLPVGISFYTFQSMSYTIDVYRGQIPRTRSPVDFALYVAFFPQLVAGPIVRAADFLPQLREPVRLFFDRETFFLIARGLAKKVLIADNVAVLADHVFADPVAWPSLVIWLATICFAVQIYCDFSGYSDMAIGISRILGFRLPKNFDYPYFARNPSDFWRRWHISLSSWLRDYLYIPLGGNRKGPSRTYVNLMLTMLLGGLWHGASWNFVVWGFLHGFALMVHRFYVGLPVAFPAARTMAGRRLRGAFATLAMQYWVLLTWVAFRVTDFESMGAALESFVFFEWSGVTGLGLGAASAFSSLVGVAAFGVVHLGAYPFGGSERALARLPLWAAAALCVVLGFALFMLWPTHNAPFIYFQF